ncbi:hypothetical protein TNCV_4606231 [Trichonephila clavipes]|nr:hypothetical protein TNCV_4606231 [Trichonephila clavipes]
MKDIGDGPRNSEPWLKDESDTSTGTPVSFPHHTNVRTSSHNRFNVHQPLYTVGRQWPQDSNSQLVDHKSVTMTTRLPRSFNKLKSSREDSHVTRMALMDHAAPSRALSQELGSFTRQQVSARTVR